MFIVTIIDVMTFAAGVTGDAGLKPVQVDPAGKSGQARVTGLLKLLREVNEHEKVRVAAVGTVTDGSHVIEKLGTGGPVTVTLEVTVWPSESTTVTVAVPVPGVVAVNGLVPGGITYGLPPSATIPVLLE